MYKVGDVVVEDNYGRISVLTKKKQYGDSWMVGFTLAEKEDRTFRDGIWAEKNFRHAKNSEKERYIKSLEE